VGGMSDDRFRFRVWDNANKRYVDTFLDPYNRIWRWYIDIDGNLIGVDEDNVDRVQDKENFIIEQCTGLKDKNGNLIFEGDVVSDMGIEAVVGWYSDKYMIEYDDGSIGELAIAAEALEIIGNIHEYERKENE
jgi:uncharacterized phage protein (TIGR01671 family)